MTKNQQWLSRLRGTVDERDDAIRQLRGMLVRGLSRSIAPPDSGLQAEDIAQEALLKILSSLDQFRGLSEFTTWAMTIATRIGISEKRRLRFKDVSLDSLTGEDGMRIDVPQSNEVSAQQVDMKQLVLSRLNELIETELSDRQRIAMRAMLDGMTVEDIAAKLNSNRNAIYKLAHDARTKLRDGLERSDILGHDVNLILP